MRAAQYAAEAGHAPTVELLVKAGAELDRQTAQGSTALLMAATTTAGLSPMHIRVAHPDFPAVVRGLVDAGADVNLPGVFWGFCCLSSSRTLMLCDKSCHAFKEAQPSPNRDAFYAAAQRAHPPPDPASLRARESGFLG